VTPAEESAASFSKKTTFVALYGATDPALASAAKHWRTWRAPGPEELREVTMPAVVLDSIFGEIIRFSQECVYISPSTS